VNAPSLLLPPLASSDKNGPSASNQGVAKWSYNNIVEWLVQCNLKHLQNWFVGFDGVLLLEYRDMRRAAPDTFYQMLRSSGVSLVDMLRLSNALNQL